jgi:hypothetical protein
LLCSVGKQLNKSELFFNGEEWRMRRPRSAKTGNKLEAARTTKTLGVRYAELLKLREAVAKTQSNAKLLSHVDQSAGKQGREPSRH